METKQVTQFKKQVTSLLKAMETTDTKSKNIFNLAVTILKSSVSIKEGVKSLNDILDTYNDKYQKHYVNRVKRIIKTASIAVDNKLMINADDLKWYNIEKATKLMEHLNEYFQSDVTKVKNKLNKIKQKAYKSDKSLDVKKYNDLYDEELSELYKNYKLEDDDIKTYAKVETMIAKLSEDYKKKLLAELQAELKGEWNSPPTKFIDLVYI